MPDWEAYSYISHSTGTTAWGSTAYTATQVQQQYEEYKQRREQQERRMEQLFREEEERVREEYLREKERQKYPLFFWRETCSKQRKETCK